MSPSRIAIALLAIAAGASAARAVTIEVGSVTGNPGDTVSVVTTLRTMGAEVQGIINELAVGALVPVSGCTVNPIFNEIGIVRLQPQSCEAGVDCLSVRAVLAQFPTANIADGTVLYSCDFKIAASASGSYPITCSGAEAGDPNTNPLEVSCSNGEITVGTAACTGDCDGNGEVFGNEVTVAINIVAGNAELSSCSNADANDDGEVFGNEVTIAINNVANGCPQ